LVLERKRRKPYDGKRPLSAFLGQGQEEEISFMPFNKGNGQLDTENRNKK